MCYKEDKGLVELQLASKQSEGGQTAAEQRPLNSARLLRPKNNYSSKKR